MRFKLITILNCIHAPLGRLTFNYVSASISPLSIIYSLGSYLFQSHESSKFGGTSVANTQNINRVLSIVKKEDKCTVVVSAGGITDRLLQAMEQAAQTDEAYKEVLVELEERHLEVIRGNIPANKQSGLISFVKVQLNLLETILDGIYMLQEITQKQQIK